MKLPLLFCAASALTLFTSTGSATEDFYVGTYTKFFGSKGIYHFQFDEKTGTISKGQLAAEASNPSFLVVHPNRHWLYAANEREVGVINAYSIAPDGRLQLLSRQSSRGAGPCHLSLDASHRFVFVANYNAGTIASLPIQRGGGVGPASGYDQHVGGGVNHERQEGPHAHSIYAAPDNRFVYSCDLGNDQVEGYRFDNQKGTLQLSKTATTGIAPGSGPRHLVMHPRGDVYVINEMANTVTALHRDSGSGAMHTFQTVHTLPAGYNQPSTTAEIALHPNGKFLYASNRGHDSIAVFAIAGNGRLSLVEHISTKGKTPRFFTFDPSGRWLLAANQNSNDIFVFRADSHTGKLTPNGQKVNVGAPVCIDFVRPK
ncbi:MAG TPA: lactonase family protein [Chthoniobacter sp.]|nr:lactonase family protein [Chthoniobacter sp.]